MATATTPDLTRELLGDLGVTFVDDIDKAAASSGDVPPDKYHGRQDGAKLNDSGGASPRWEIWFVILAGPFKGRKVKYTIWTETGTTEKDGSPKTADKLHQDRERVKNEIEHAARVLGIKRRLQGDLARKYVVAQLTGRAGVTAEQIARAGDAVAADPKGVTVPVEGKHDFRDAINAECVVKTVLRPSTRDGDDRKFAEVDRFGVLELTDSKAKGAVLATPGSVPPPASGGGGNGTARQDFSDLASGV